MIIADGEVDPVNQLTYSMFSYAVGLLDPRNHAIFENMELVMRQQIFNGELYNATLTLINIQFFLGSLIPDIFVDNYRQYLDNSSMAFPDQDLTIFDCATQLIGNGDYLSMFQIDPSFIFKFQNGTVLTNLYVDVSNSTAFMLPYILDAGVEVLVFVGQDDSNWSPPGVMDYLNNLDWQYITDFRMSPRKIWLASNGTVLGTYKNCENLTFVTVYKAGHLGTIDQPASIMDLMNRFINNAWN